MSKYAEIKRSVEPKDQCIMRLYVQDANGTPVADTRVKVWAGMPPYFNDDQPFRSTNSAGALEYIAVAGAMPENRDYYMQIIDANAIALSDPIKFPFERDATTWITVIAAAAGKTNTG